MGQTTIIDIITSTVIAGMLLLIALRLNAQAMETTAVYHSNLTLQQNLTALVGILEHDFRRIAYCKDYTKIPFPTMAMRKADSSEIMFWTDIDNDGNIDSIHYYVGPKSELSGTSNPNDRKLYRVVNGQQAAGWTLGVTRFEFKYFNSMGDTLQFPVTNPGEVHSMEISVAVESPEPFAIEYTATADTLADFQTFWRQLRLAARNLRNR